MASNVTAGSKSGATGLLPSLSPNTASILATPKAIRTTEDGASFEVDATWDLPREIPETLVVECRRWLAAHEAASGIAQEGRIKHWLIRLLGGMPGDYSPEAVQLKMGAFVFALSDYRAYCFDDATLKLAMRRFKFWPSAAELIDFADEMDRWTRQTAARAWKVVDKGPVAALPAGNDAGRAISSFRERQDRERRALAAVVEAKYGAMPPMPEREPGESDNSFMNRLQAWRNGPRLPLPEPEPADAEAGP